MFKYKEVVGYKVHGEHQGWIRKKWEQNLRKYKMEGTATFDAEENLKLVITSKINLKRIKKASHRFQKKLHEANDQKPGCITYILKDGQEVSPDRVFSSEDFHKLQRLVKGEL